MACQMACSPWSSTIDDKPHRRLLDDLRKRREEGRFRLARSRCSGHDYISVTLDDERNGRFLGLPQLFPALSPDETLDALVQLEKGRRISSHGPVASKLEGSESIAVAGLDSSIFSARGIDLERDAPK